MLHPPQSTRSVERPFFVFLLGLACWVTYTTAMAAIRHATSIAKGIPPGCLTCSSHPPRTLLTHGMFAAMQHTAVGSLGGVGFPAGALPEQDCCYSRVWKRQHLCPAVDAIVGHEDDVRQAVPVEVHHLQRQHWRRLRKAAEQMSIVDVSCPSAALLCRFKMKAPRWGQGWKKCTLHASVAHRA